MKISSLCAFLALSSAPAIAQVAVPNLAPLPATASAPKMATVTPFVTGLKEPQGMALEDTGPNSNILIADYETGEILKFGRKGARYPKPLATGLKGPTMMVKTVTDLFVSESKANRVLRFEGTDLGFVFPFEPVGKNVLEPSGLAFQARKPHPDQSVNRPLEWMGRAEELMVTSPATSQIYGFSLSSLWQREWKPIYGSPKISANSCLVFDGSVLFMTDDSNGEVLIISPQGRAATFASGIAKPSGIAIGPDNLVYVANEGDGGQLIRLNSEGEKTVVAEKLGRPRGILFLDAKTVLVSNRDGNVWKVALP